MLCIAFALRQEARPFLRRFPQRQMVSRAPCEAWLCSRAGRSVLVLETGAGEGHARAALDWLFASPGGPGRQRFSPSLLLAAGFAGGLNADCPAGAIVVATEVVDQHGRVIRCAEDVVSGELAQRRRLLTTTEMIGSPQAKRLLGMQTGAGAVDMESAILGHICQERGVPFAAVRVISDAVDTQLSPQLLQVLAGSRVRPARLLWNVMRRPGLVGELLHLAGTTQRGARRLAELLDDHVFSRPVPAVAG